MKIAVRCGKCRIIQMQGEDDLFMEFDFYEQKITYVCSQCKNENIMNMEKWKKAQEKSPLPRIGTM